VKMALRILLLGAIEEVISLLVSFIKRIHLEDAGKSSQTRIQVLPLQKTRENVYTVTIISVGEEIFDISLVRDRVDLAIIFDISILNTDILAELLKEKTAYLIVLDSFRYVAYEKKEFEKRLRTLAKHVDELIIINYSKIILENVMSISHALVTLIIYIMQNLGLIPLRKAQIIDILKTIIVDESRRKTVIKLFKDGMRYITRYKEGLH